LIRFSFANISNYMLVFFCRCLNHETLATNERK
jgi:hypothetical protein